ALIFARATGDLERVFLEVRTLLKGLQFGVSILVGVSARSAALPALVGHVLVLSHAVQCVFRCGGIVGDVDASSGVVDQLVSLFDLLLVPLVVDADDRASVV